MRKSDPEKQRELVACLRQHQATSSDALCVSLAEFFDGNHDYGSIGCNLNDSPGPQGFYRALKGLLALDGVQGVRVELSPLEDEGAWPFSEMVHVITRLPLAAIQKAVTELQPSRVAYLPPNHDGRMRASLSVPPVGYRVVTLWWD